MDIVIITEMSKAIHEEMTTAKIHIHVVLSDGLLSRSAKEAVADPRGEGRGCDLSGFQPMK